MFSAFKNRQYGDNMKRIKASIGKEYANYGMPVAGGRSDEVESVLYQMDGKLVQWRKNTKTNKVTWWKL